MRPWVQIPPARPIINTMNSILLNDEEYHFSETDLPCLVHYGAGVGGSLFSVSMVVDLFRQGSKILFLTGYPMAQDNFLEQISGQENKVIIAHGIEQLLEEKQVIIIESGNHDLFMKALSKLGDIEDRIIFIKNFDILNTDIVKAASQYGKAIISGDLDSSPLREYLRDLKFTTIIRFSKSSCLLAPSCPKLDKYVGYLWQKNKDGLLKLAL